MITGTEVKMTSLAHHHRAFTRQPDENAEEEEEKENVIIPHSDAETAEKPEVEAAHQRDNALVESSCFDDSDGNEEELTPDQIPTVKEMKIKFDIIDSKLVEEAQQKYTVYVILVMETSRLDDDEAVFERRYNDFDQLHKGLRKECPKVMKNVPFPKKKIFSKFKSMIVEDRSRTFEKYLRYIYHLEGVIETKAFRDFFFLPHLKEATQFLKSQEHKESYDEYKLAFELQRKLRCTSKEMKILAMCGIVAASKELQKYETVEEIGEECLNLMLYDISNPFLLGLMDKVLDAKKRLCKPTENIKAKMAECLKKCSYERDSINSLKVLLVKRF